MPRLLLVTLLLGIAVVPADALTLEEAKALFADANQAFQDGNEAAASDPGRAREHYRSAALRYERLIEEGSVSNGKLYYNLGNAYFRTGEIGRAILNYRRAQRLRPGDDNLRRNLTYARSQRLDRIEESSSGQALRTLLFWHYDLSPSTRWSVFVAAWLLLWGLAALRLKRRTAAPTFAIVAAAVVAFAFGGSLAAESVDGSSHAGVITAFETVARKGDADSYAPAFEQALHEGVEFSLLEERRDWIQIELPDGRTAWIESSAAELL